MVIFVPRNGIKINVGKNVPKRLPIVEKANIFPEISPTFSSLIVAILIKKGLVIPRSTKGTPNKIIENKRDPRIINKEIEDGKTTTNVINSSCISNGENMHNNPADKMILNKKLRSGFFSDIFPPK